MIPIKTLSEIEAMREGGRILAEILHKLAMSAKIGVSTKKLDAEAESLMKQYSVIPSFKGYREFPATICTSINEEVVHGIPSDRILKNGDILSIDCGILHKGMHTDSAVAIMLGDVAPSTKNFVLGVQKALEKGIRAIAPGCYVEDVSFAIGSHIKHCGYSVVHEFIGHGVGKSLHEPPEVPNEGQKGKGPMLLHGMTIAIEPIIAMGKRFIETLPDKWTAVTRDKSPACQVEHTVLITKTGYEILTKYDNNINLVYVH